MANTKQRNLEELCYGALKEINYAERKILNRVDKWLKQPQMRA